MFRLVVLFFVCTFSLLSGPTVRAQTSEMPQPVVPPPGEQAPPVMESVVLRQGAAEFSLGNYEEALDAFTLARTTEPGSAAAAFYLGITLKKLQRFGEAVPHLRAASELQPPVKQALLELADACAADNRIDEALQAIGLAERERIEPAQTAFLKGLMLTSKRSYAEAVVYFEKAKSLDQNLAPAADFRIASIYQRVGLLAKARGLYGDVAQKTPDSPVGNMALQHNEALGRLLDTKATYTFTASVQRRYDSNVLLKPDNAPATETISGEADVATAILFVAEYAPRYRLPHGLTFYYSVSQDLYQELKAYDVQSHVLGAARTYRSGDMTASLPIRFNLTLVDNSKYLQEAAVAPACAVVTGENQYVQASVLYAVKGYKTDPLRPDENRDGDEVAAGLAWFRLLSGKKGFVSLAYDLSRENTAGANWSYWGNKVGAGALYPLSEFTGLSLGFEVFHQAFNKPNTNPNPGFYHILRADTSYQGSARLLYGFTRTLEAQIEYAALKNASTIRDYGYQKRIIGIGLNARF